MKIELYILQKYRLKLINPIHIFPLTLAILFSVFNPLNRLSDDIFVSEIGNIDPEAASKTQQNALISNADCFIM